MIIRFDSVSGNTDFTLLYEKIDFLRSKMNCGVYLSYSPLYHNAAEGGRTYRQILDDLSDYKNFFNVNTCKLHRPKREGIEIVSHGLIYVDHRLLTYAQQELSILTTRYLVNSKKFVPPFNKYNEDTEKICNKYLISLIKTEDLWSNFDREKFTSQKLQWFTQSYKHNLDQFKEIINNGL